MEKVKLIIICLVSCIGVYVGYSATKYIHVGQGSSHTTAQSIVAVVSHTPTAAVKKLVPNAVSQVDVTKPLIKPGYVDNESVVVESNGNTAIVNMMEVEQGFPLTIIGVGGYGLGEGIVVGGIGVNVFQWWRCETQIIGETNFKMVDVGIGESYLIDNNLAGGIMYSIEHSLIAYISIKL